MTTKVTGRLAAGFLAVTALVVATIAPGGWNTAETGRSAQSGSRQLLALRMERQWHLATTNYRETFTYLGAYAVATKPNQPLDEMHNVYAQAGRRPSVSP